MSSMTSIRAVLGGSVRLFSSRASNGCQSNFTGSMTDMRHVISMNTHGTGMKSSFEWAMHPTSDTMTLQFLNRNARRPKKANHGARPCSNYGRRKRRARR